MNTIPAELLVSFWKISLSNFPKGDFRHRELTGKEASQLVAGVRETGQVLFGSQDDIAAPYGQRQLRKTTELARVLSEHWGIPVTAEDFFTDFEGGGSCARPIDLYDIRASRPLLVVTCSYVHDRKTTLDDLGMSVAPDTVRFHLFEMTGACG